MLIKEIDNNNDKYSYKYDKLNNITHIYHNDCLENKYYYNKYNELIREDNYLLNETIRYKYDNLGNLLYKKICELKTYNQITEHKYEYNNSNWRDQLTKFNEDVISYDEIGNPITIGSNIRLSWINGRQLNSYVDLDNTISYKYNKDGVRVSKIINDIETKYYLEGSSIIVEKIGNDVLYYLYSTIDNLVGFKYNDNLYYYIKNNQEDIIGILDSDYNVVANYKYDSLGKILSITDGTGEDVSENSSHIANINPFRYRSYYYDKETNLYYLNNRYYNPLWGRFINVDNIINSNNDILSHNLYLYCSNNPVSNMDKNGLGLLSIIVKTVKCVFTIYKKVKSAIQKINSTNTTTGESTKNNQNLPDYTEALNKVLIKNSAQATVMKNSVSSPSSLNYFYEQVKSNGEWDYKVEENWLRDIDVPYLGVTGEFLYNGQVTTAEEFGNIHYGFIGAHMGYSSTILFMGGGYAKCGIDVRIFEPPYYCDDENDHYGIQRGIDMYYNR